MLIVGTSKGETLTGTRRDDTIIGSGGTDTVIAKGGNDTIVARGYINAMGGRDRYFSVDQFRLFFDKNYDVTSPKMGGGHDLLVIDEDSELDEGPGRNGFYEVDMGAGNDRVILGGADGGSLSLGQGADTAYILGSTTMSIYLADSYLDAGGQRQDGDEDDIHYNAGAGGDSITFLGFDAEDCLTIYGSGMNYQTAMARIEYVGNDHKLTLFDGSTIWIVTDIGAPLSRDQLKFVDAPATVAQKVLVAGETEEERAIFGSLFDDTLRIKNGALFLGAGDDIGRGSDGSERLHGQDGDDQLIGRGSSDILRGGIGNDRLSGGDGNDLIATGRGADTVFAGAGRDVIIAQGGADRGNDTIFAGGGSDRIVFRDELGVNTTIRTVSTGSGRDIVRFEDSSAGIVVLTDFRANRDKFDFAFLKDSPAQTQNGAVETFIDSARDAMEVRPGLGISGTLYRYNSLEVIVQSASANHIDAGDIFI